MKLLILHLSDIHIKDELDEILYLDETIAQSLYSHLDKNSQLVILISGDIAFSGQEEQYNLAYEFLKNIERHIRKEQDIKIDFIICPGNHDCDFAANPTREFMLDRLANEDLTTIDSQILESCVTHQKSFFDFRNKIETNLVEDDVLWRTSEIEILGKKIIFESLNYSWSSTLDEKQGKILFPFSLYNQKAKRNADVRISLMHHPLNWLNQSAYREFRTSLRAISNFVFTGHEHAANVINHGDRESGDTVIFEGGVLQEKDIENSCFVLVELDFNTNENKYIEYKFSTAEKIYIPLSENNVIPVRENRGNSFFFRKEFMQKLEDCGGYYRHSNKENLKLSDFFVYPNLTINSDDESKQKIISSKVLLKDEKIEKGVVLSADDNVGSTSLIYTLIVEYYSKGFIPLLIHGSDINKKNNSSIDLKIQKAILEQYEGEKASILFDQSSKSKKILFIDDFDEIKLKSEKSKKEILDYLKSKFYKVILTVDSVYEVGDLVATEEISVWEGFGHYKIEAFGYKKRTELIQKWYSLGQLDSEDESEVIGKCNTAEKLMDSVMDKSLISLCPIFLLTFLQSIEAENSNQLSDSALGHYYKYLLTQSFLDIGIKTDNLG